MYSLVKKCNLQYTFFVSAAVFCGHQIGYKRFSHKQLVLVEVPISIGTNFFTDRKTFLITNTRFHNQNYPPPHR